MYDYYYGNAAEQFNFFRVPKRLIRDKQFQAISSDAKILYGVLLDLMTLSLKNEWLDEENRVYIIYTINSVMEQFACSKRKAISLMSELVNGGLIKKRRQGFGRPSQIYVMNFNSVADSKPDDSNSHQDTDGKKEEFQHSKTMTGTKKTNVHNNRRNETDMQESLVESGFHHWCKNLHLHWCKNMHLHWCKGVHFKRCKILHHKINTDKNDTEKDIYPSIHQNTKRNFSGIYNIYISDKSRKPDGLCHGIEELKVRLDYAALIHDGYDKDMAEELFGILADTYSACTAQDKLCVGARIIPAADMRRRLDALTMEHMKYVLESFRENRAKIRNIYAYLVMCLYNAPITIRHYNQGLFQAMESEATRNTAGGGQGYDNDMGRLQDSARETGKITADL